MSRNCSYNSECCDDCNTNYGFSSNCWESDCGCNCKSNCCCNRCCDHGCNQCGSNCKCNFDCCGCQGCNQCGSNCKCNFDCCGCQGCNQCDCFCNNDFFNCGGCPCFSPASMLCDFTEFVQTATLSSEDLEDNFMCFICNLNCILQRQFPNCFISMQVYRNDSSNSFTIIQVWKNSSELSQVFDCIKCNLRCLLAKAGFCAGDINFTTILDPTNATRVFPPEETSTSC